MRSRAPSAPPPSPSCKTVAPTLSRRHCSCTSRRRGRCERCRRPFPPPLLIGRADRCLPTGSLGGPHRWQWWGAATRVRGRPPPCWATSTCSWRSWRDRPCIDAFIYAPDRSSSARWENFYSFFCCCPNPQSSISVLYLVPKFFCVAARHTFSRY
jgi:hypothetical protein